MFLVCLKQISIFVCEKRVVNCRSTVKSGFGKRNGEKKVGVTDRKKAKILFVLKQLLLISK